MGSHRQRSILERNARNALLCGLAALALGGGAGCRRTDTPPKPAEESITEEYSSGSVRVRITAVPARIQLDRDVLLSLRVAAPSNLTVALPPLQDRAAGFLHGGEYDRPPQREGAVLVRERHIRLTPGIAKEYRLAPLAIRVDKTPLADTPDWIITRPIRFEIAAPDAGARTAVGDWIEPKWIAPGWQTVAGWTGILLALAAALFGVVKLARHVRREVALRRMSPRERALHELAELMARDLVGHDQVKEFYFELTMIVRRYIERAHAIRAPEQTTEEFLEAVSRDPRFTREIVLRLRQFLQAADLVKYAAHRPDPASVAQATGTARRYIETDSADAAASREGGS